MTSLCHTCAVEHAKDNVRVECSKRGFVQPQTECPHYKPTREKQLEDALRELVDSMEELTRSMTKPNLDKSVLVRASGAFVLANELLGKVSR